MVDPNWKWTGYVHDNDNKEEMTKIADALTFDDVRWEFAFNKRRKLYTRPTARKHTF